MKRRQKRVFLEGKPVHFVKGRQNAEGIWIPTIGPENNEQLSALEKTGVVIEYPVSGQFSFEMVFLNNTRYIMSHF